MSLGTLPTISISVPRYSLWGCGLTWLNTKLRDSKVTNRHQTQVPSRAQIQRFASVGKKEGREHSDKSHRSHLLVRTAWFSNTQTEGPGLVLPVCPDRSGTGGHLFEYRLMQGPGWNGSWAFTVLVLMASV